MSTLENEINGNLSNGFWEVWFPQNCMSGVSILTALNKMKPTNQHQHSDGLLQGLYTMTQVSMQWGWIWQLVRYVSNLNKL